MTYSYIENQDGEKVVIVTNIWKLTVKLRTYMLAY